MEEQKITDKVVAKEKIQYSKELSEMRSMQQQENRDLYSEYKTVTYDPSTGKLMQQKTRRK